VGSIEVRVVGKGWYMSEGRRGTGKLWGSLFSSQSIRKM